VEVVSIEARPGEFRNEDIENVNRHYFRAMRIPLGAGRLFDEGDSFDQVPVAVIGQSFVQRFFPGEGPIGKLIQTGPENSKSPWTQIVSLVGDIKYSVFETHAALPRTSGLAAAS
jgi:hypothetical protein